MTTGLIQNKISFLDIDGVLNLWKKKWNKESVRVYNQFIHDYKYQTVITSTWRIQYSIEELQNIFNNQGLNIKIHDYVKNLNNRSLEIQEYVSDNNITEYVVFDDKEINVPSNHFIRVNGIKGLQQNDITCYTKYLS